MIKFGNLEGMWVKSIFVTLFILVKKESEAFFRVYNFRKL